MFIGVNGGCMTYYSLTGHKPELQSQSFFLPQRSEQMEEGKGEDKCFSPFDFFAFLQLPLFLYEGMGAMLFFSLLLLILLLLLFIFLKCVPSQLLTLTLTEEDQERGRMRPSQNVAWGTSLEGSRRAPRTQSTF